MAKTALQEIMDVFEMDYSNGVEISMKVLYKMLSKGLKKEKQQIIEAVDFALLDETGLEYYNKNYNS